MTQFVDFVALGWVEQNLRGEIEAARKCLHHYQREPDNNRHLQEAERNIHSATSALRLCTLEPAALLSQEIELVLAMLQKDEIASNDRKQAMTELVAAIEALPAYLASVRSLREITPGSITKVVNDLRQFGNRPALPESMFFNPPMPDGAGISNDVTPLPEEALVAFAERAMRIAHKYSQGALSRDKDALVRLHAMGEHATQQLAGTSMEPFFRCYSALLQCMAQNRLRADEVIVEVLKYGFSFLRNLSMDGAAALEQASPDAYVRKMLYYIATLDAPSPQQQALLDAWGIKDAASHTRGGDQRMIQEDDLLDALRQTLEQLLEVMSFLMDREQPISADNSQLREKVVPSLLQVSMQLHVIGLSQQATAINEQYKILASYAERSEPTSQSDLIDFGAVLSSVKDALEYKLEHGLSAEGDSASLELERAISAQVGHLLQDMKALINRELCRQDLQNLVDGGSSTLTLSVGGLRPLYRAAKLVAEPGLLESIYDWEDDGFPDAASTMAIAQALLGQFPQEDDLATASHSLEQILSVLSMLEERDAECQVLSLCSDYLRHCIQLGGVVKDESMQCFSEAIAALEQFLECRMEDPHSAPEEHLLRATERAELLEDLISKRMNRENPDRNVVEFVPAGHAPRTAGGERESLELESPALPASATPEPAPETTQAPEPASTATAKDSQSWRQAMALWSASRIERPAEPESDGPDAEIDAELRECFVEECDEYLAKLSTAAAELVTNPRDEALIKSIRVVFHTMKGSARTIGLLALGEFMHDMERIFNALRDGLIEGNDDIAEFVSVVAAKMPEFPSQITARIPMENEDFQIPSLIADAIAGNALTDEFSVAIPTSMQATVTETGGTTAADEPAVAESAPLVSDYEPGIWSNAESREILEQAINELTVQAGGDSQELVHRAGELLTALVPCLVELRDGGFLDLSAANAGYFLDLSHLEHLASGAVYGLVEDQDGNQSRVSISEQSAAKLAAYVQSVKADPQQHNEHRDLEAMIQACLALEDADSLSASEEPARAIPDNVVAFSNPADSTEESATPEVEEIDEELLELFIETLDEYSESMDSSLSQLNAGKTEGLRGLKNTLHTVKGAANSIGLRQLGSLIHEQESGVADLEAELEIGSAEFLAAVESLAAEFTDATRYVRRNKCDWNDSDEVTSVCEEEADITNVAAVDTAEPSERRADTLRVDTLRVDRLLDMGLEISMSNVRARQSLDAAVQGRTEVQNLSRRILALVDQLSLQLDTEIQAKTEAMPEGEQFDPLEMDRMTEKQGLAAILREAAYDLQEESRDMGFYLDNASREASSISRLGQASQSDLRMLRLVNFSKLGPGFRRLVHQISRQLGKEVEFNFSCGEGGLDITVFEQIRTALEHMLRNAIDHGISSPEDRAKEGKAETGKVQLSINRQGSEFVIQLLDDGRGMDPELLRRKARSQGILGQNESISDEDALKLIFQSGLSTADKVTDVSGRGVGMDAVYQAITQVGGTVGVQSKPGFYTQFDVRVPASIMVNEALLATVGEEQIAIPLTSLKGSEFHRRDVVFREIQSDKGRLSFRGEKYEVRYLGAVRGSSPIPASMEAMPDFVPVLYAQLGRRRVAFFADALDTTEDLVIRSLGAQYTNVPGIAGGAVKSDGQPVLALDLNEFIGQVDHADKLATTDVKEQEQASLILCVDDSVMMRRTYEKRLESLGYRVVTAVDGEDALDYLSQASQYPDFIFTDLEMPNMNGFDFIANLRRAPQMAHIPTVVVSSRDGEKHRDEADRVGANGFMAKGANSAEAMQALIEQHIGNTPTALVS